MATSDFLGAFLENAARARILRLFVLDPERSFLLKDVSKRAGVSSQSAVSELKALEKLRVVKKGKSATITIAGTSRKMQANSRFDVWSADTNLKEFSALAKFVHEVSPVSYRNVLDALRRSGRVATVILSGNFLGDPTRPADLLVAGDSLSEARLEQAIKSLETHFGREIRYASFTTPELRYRLTVQDRLIRDTLDFPHLVLLDRAHIL